jgi:hypothetical protein
LNDIAFSWGQSPGGSSTGGSGSSGSAHQLAVCDTKARRIKNNKARNAALHHCASLYGKTTPVPTTAAQPFASTGCTTGSWPFRSQMTFDDKTTQTAQTTVACSKTG